ncbi:MAG: response regulator, partial [Lachnospiraceae bacterium]|nr:response regulator [Lachnospiraceae bacterium]
MIRVFILEDLEMSRKALTEIITSCGESGEIVVDAAASLEEGRHYVESDTTYDAFFLDINLDESREDDQSGLELARLIRAKRKYEFTPVIMVTSIAKLEMAAYRELHCYQYLIKPYIEEDVRTLMSKLQAMRNVKEEKTIVVKKDGINYRIKCNAIVYVEAVPRGVC